METEFHFDLAEKSTDKL